MFRLKKQCSRKVSEVFLGQKALEILEVYRKKAVEVPICDVGFWTKRQKMFYES